MTSTKKNMKNNIVTLSFCAVLWLIGTDVCAQPEKSISSDSLPEHPRLLLLKGEEKAIKEMVSSGEAWKNINKFIIDKCDEVIGKPPVERILIGRRLLDKSREALRRIFYLSYVWRITTETKYLERAEKELLAVSAFSDWNPSHFLDVAEMTMAVAIGYDWLYGELSQETREILRNAIVEKGLKPSLMPSNSGWVKATHNWNQVCNAGMTYGALAVYEDQPDLASGIIERSKNSILLAMNDYEPDGAYPEGYSYWGYGTSFNIMFLNAMEKAFGSESVVKINPGFLKTAAYLENMTGPSGNCFNYSDCGQVGNMHPAMFWFANRLNDPSLLWSEKQHMTGKNLPNDRLLPAVLIWGAGITMDRINSPSKLVWAGQGKNPVALMRTSWTDTEAIFAGLKAGSPSVNHGHMDAGSFIMEANGERWAMDLGMQDYNSLETKGVNLWSMAQNSQRWDVFRYNNFVHNTLSVNNQLQNVRGYADISSCSESPEMIRAISDISSVYEGQLKKAVRGIAIVDKKYVMVRDEVESLADETLIRWNMLTSAVVTITGKSSALLTKNGRKLILKVSSPRNIVMKTWSTEPKHDYDAPNPGTTMVGFEATIPADSKAILTVLLLPGNTKENRKVTVKKLSDW